MSPFKIVEKKHHLLSKGYFMDKTLTAADFVVLPTGKVDR